MLLFLGRIHEKKGCDLLASAFARAAAQDNGLVLAFAGPDPDHLRARLEALLPDPAVAGRVHWLGMLMGDTKWGALRACEAFVLPSHQENFGIAVVEAMACGKPVLISDKVQIWREVDAAGAGLVEPDTLDGTERLLSRWQALPVEARETMGARGREAFLQQFRIDAAVDGIRALMEEARRHAQRRARP
jgi:glycosyltransferase involved in cell wall biosynthesis